ncbi:MAG: hypothetical protein JKY94_11700 [Rhodobacteraceae bacterium]|nr:hypothetical protein [Paracoccaceae bacterium]
MTEIGDFRQRDCRWKSGLVDGFRRKLTSRNLTNRQLVPHFGSEENLTVAKEKSVSSEFPCRPVNKACNEAGMAATYTFRASRAAIPKQKTGTAEVFCNARPNVISNKI